MPTLRSTRQETQRAVECDAPAQMSAQRKYIISRAHPKKSILRSPALLSTMLSVDRSTKRNISVIADSSSESVGAFAGNQRERSHVNTTMHDRGTAGPNVDKGKSAAGPAA